MSVANVEACSLVMVSARTLAFNPKNMFSIVKGYPPKLVQVCMRLLRRCEKAGHYVDGEGKKCYAIVGKKLLDAIHLQLTKHIEY